MRNLEIYLLEKEGLHLLVHGHFMTRKCSNKIIVIVSAWSDAPWFALWLLEEDLIEFVARRKQGTRKCLPTRAFYCHS